VPLPPSLRTDLEYAKRGFRRYAAYPAATFGGLFTNTVFGFMRAFVILALFAGRADVGGYDRAAAVTYTWLTQGLIATIYIWGWQDLSLRIRTGDIATDLIRPVHPLRAGLAFDLGRAVYHAIFRGIPPVLVGALFFTLILPADALAWIAFALSVALAVTVSYGFRALYNILSFWLLDHRGTTLLAVAAVNFFSGFILPVRFFPAWLEAVARITPFPAMVQVPVDIFVGRITGSDVAVALVGQLAWAVVLLAGSRAVFALGVRRLVVQGG
jgi:viologen exporter family transport system permease protein